MHNEERNKNDRKVKTSHLQVKNDLFNLCQKFFMSSSKSQRMVSDNKRKII